MFSSSYLKKDSIKSSTSLWFYYAMENKSYLLLWSFACQYLAAGIESFSGTFSVPVCMLLMSVFFGHTFESILPGVFY